MFAGAATASAAKSPEYQNRGPSKDAGYFLGHPLPTYSWHNCTKTSSYQTSVTRPAGYPAHRKGNKQGKVKWSTTYNNSATATGGIVVKWKVAKKWQICGVQIAVLGYHKDAPAYLGMMGGYTSGKKKGNTAKGKESIKVRVTKKQANMIGLEKGFGNKSYRIDKVYSIYVFVKKKK